MDEVGLDVLRLVGRRSDLLAALLEDARDKRELEGVLEESRSTIDRALKELEETGLVRWEERGYRATLAGRLQLQLYREFVGRSTDLLDAIEFLEALPPDAPIDPGLLRGCRVEGPKSLERYDILPSMNEMLERGDRVVVALSPNARPSALRRLVETANDRGITTEAFLAPEFAEVLEAQFPELLGGLAAGDGRVHEAPVETIGLLFLSEEGEVGVAAESPGGHPLGAVHNDTPEAATWARQYVESLRESGTEITEDARQMARMAGDRDRLVTQGFVDLADVEPREDARALTGWRTGLDLAEVGAGHALERERPDGNGRSSVTDEVTDLLADGTDVALIGPPGSGKSTVCKCVAWRWHRADRGPVLYRETGSGDPFESWPLLAEVLRYADGHALVVVEDAVRSDANEIFRVLAEFTDRDDVTVLLDAREHEWRDPPAFPADGRLEAYRVEEMETVTMPAVDAEEVRRFVERFEAETGTQLAIEPDQLLAAIREREGEQAAPAALQLLLHRLSLRAAPLVADEFRTPTTLVEDVRRMITSVQPLGAVGLEVAALANLLIAAGMVVRPAYLHAVGGVHGDHDAVRGTVEQLEGRVLFPEDDGYRTVHESWSALFLETLRTDLGEAEAAERVGAAVTALLTLADDPALRDDVADAVAVSNPGNLSSGGPAGIRRFEEDPRGWATETIERLFEAAREYPRLAPLFGRPGGDTVALPDALPRERRADVALWRGEAALEGGYLDVAETAFDRLGEHAPDWAPERADVLREQAVTKLGTVAFRRGDTEAAEPRYREALEAAEARGDEERIATCRKHLGNVAFVRGDTDVAEEHYRAALEIYQGLDDRLGTAYVRHNLGNVADSRGDRTTAERHYVAALSIYRDLGNRGDEADCLNNLGVIAEARGDLAAAGNHYRECLDRYRSIGDRIGQANALANLGLVAEKRADPEPAERYAGRALERYREVGDTQGEAHAHRVLAGAARQRGDFEAAGEHLEASDRRAKDVGERVGEAITAVREARLERDREDLAAAEAAAERTLELSSSSDQGLRPASAKVVLGDVARRRDSFDRAGEYFDEAERHFRDAGSPLGVAVALAGRAAVARSAGDVDGAVTALREATLTVAGEVASETDPGALLVAGCERAGHLDGLAEDLRATLRDGEGSIDDRLEELERRLRAA